MGNSQDFRFLTFNGYISQNSRAATLAVLLITYLLLLGANRIQHFIGNAGAAIISRVMGLILATVAVNNVLIGLKDFFVQIA